MTRIKSLKGFTLIELIVVVIIIGVLAAIAAVAYNQFVAQARTTAAVANDMTAAAVLADGATAGGDATKLDREELGLSEGVFISPIVSTGTAGVDEVKTVTVYSGKDNTAKHFCELDVTGDIPNLKMATCK